MQTDDISVREIMTAEVQTIPPDTPIEVLFERFTTKGCTDLVVVDAAGKFLGVITEFDLLSAVSPIMGVRTAKRIPCIECLLSGSATVAADILTRRHITIEETASVTDAMRMMQKNRHPDLFVIDRQGRLVGQVEVCNIISHLRIVGRL